MLAIQSSGLHTNGFSMVRSIYKDVDLPRDYVKKLSNPNRCYLNEITTLIDNGVEISGLCHITGGGLIDNPPRVLPKNLKLDLDYDKLFNDELYDWIKSLNYVNEEEMLKVFNCGYGMLVIISPEEFNKLNANDYTILGKIIIH